MPESTSDASIARQRPALDFAARWEGPGRQHYRYRVPSLQLLLVDAGRLWAIGPDGRVSAGEGELLVLQRQQLNEYGWDAPVRFWEAHLTFREPPLLEDRPLPSLVRLGEHADTARAGFETWCQELDRPGDLPALRVQAATAGVLASIAAALGRAPARRKPDAWERARERLEANLGRDLLLGEVARAAGMSEDHLIRGFRKRFGLSPMAWRQRAALRHACLLIDAGTPVKEAAHRVGFADASAFTRAFRRRFGVPPSQYTGHGRPPEPPDAEAGYPRNRHIRPPGSSTPWFTWG